ncbi:hypothetical protein [Agrobacterium tumefaciens]|uniref:hypothetical protein n=1 Tax=Agrobacterium tumefaciens TaxID=358 RepID=UPI001AE7BBCF|nr:hypothetical protein [Agrobacterium tumefaciens]MBP2534868.1 hypothetical protein [Agrobacterium tumefaciens]
MTISDKDRPRIALLGWGSLIWDVRPEFDDQHGTWQDDGPVLPLEFSRVSGVTRGRALTLVIDTANGSDCTVKYAFSKRRDPEDAIADLRGREGTILKRIGFWFADGKRKYEFGVPGAIATWAQERKFDAVIWTALESNFEKETGENFSIDAAITHLQSLPPEGKAMAAEYVWRAPSLVNTPLRLALQGEPWFMGENNGSEQ